MAARFAGDYFGISLTEPDEGGSTLLKYFPSLRSAPVPKRAEGTEKEFKLYETVGAAPTFGGFKTFEAGSSERVPTPVFGGFKALSNS